jgi:hypothetical protein
LFKIDRSRAESDVGHIYAVVLYRIDPGNLWRLSSRNRQIGYVGPTHCFVPLRITCAVIRRSMTGACEPLSNCRRYSPLLGSIIFPTEKQSETTALGSAKFVFPWTENTIFCVFSWIRRIPIGVLPCPFVSSTKIENLGWTLG